jgi:ribosomal protein L9
MSLCFHTQREGEEEEEEEEEEGEESAKDLKDSAQDLQESTQDHNVTFSTFTPVSVASEDSIAVELIKASIPPPPAASILPKFNFLLVAVEGSRSSPIPKGWI